MSTPGPTIPRYPVLCMDEQPIQLLKETRQPIPGTKTHPRRVDYEYERAGTASIFMFCEPLSGWRQVSRARASNEDRLGRGSRGFAENPLRVGGEGDLGLR